MTVEQEPPARTMEQLAIVSLATVVEALALRMRAYEEDRVRWSTPHNRSPEPDLAEVRKAYEPVMSMLRLVRELFPS